MIDQAIHALTFLVGVVLVVGELFVHEPTRGLVVFLGLVLMGVITFEQLRRMVAERTPPPPISEVSNDTAG